MFSIEVNFHDLSFFFKVLSGQPKRVNFLFKLIRSVIRMLLTKSLQVDLNYTPVYG